MAIGTPAYMSPEQSAGELEIDGRSDLYSLGVVGYQMACGDLPFIAPNTPSMLVKHLSEIPMPVDQRRPDLPTDLSRVIMMMLEKDPSNRFPDAESVVVALSSGVMPTLRTLQSPATPAPLGGATSRRQPGADAAGDSAFQVDARRKQLRLRKSWTAGTRIQSRNSGRSSRRISR